VVDIGDEKRSFRQRETAGRAEFIKIIENEISRVSLTLENRAL